MTYREARKFARSFNNNPQKPGVTYKAAKQYWRDGPYWYVKASDGSGIFKEARVGLLQ